MFYLIDVKNKRLLLSREDLEQIKDHVREMTGEKEVKKALNSLNAVIGTDVYPYLLN